MITQFSSVDGDNVTIAVPKVSLLQRLTTKFAIGQGLMFLGIVIAMAWGVCLYVSFSGGKLVQIQTSSMQPVLPVGTVVNLHPIQASQIAKGDIIAFYPPSPYPHVLVVHEVAATTTKGSNVSLSTRGVAENHNDPWQLTVPATATLGTVVHTVTPNLLHLLMFGVLLAIVSYWIGFRIRSIALADKDL